MTEACTQIDPSEDTRPKPEPAVEQSTSAPARTERQKSWVALDAIWASNDLVVEEVPVPEWSAADQAGVVYVAMMPAGRRDQYDIARYRKRNTEGVVESLSALTVAFTMCDPNGVFLFDTPTAIDEAAKKLSGKATSAIERIYERAIILNKLGAAAVLDLAGN